VGAVDSDDTCKTEIYGSSQKCWGDSQCNKVNKKVVIVERRAVKHDSSNIANNLKDLKKYVSL